MYSGRSYFDLKSTRNIRLGRRIFTTKNGKNQQIHTQLMSCYFPNTAKFFTRFLSAHRVWIVKVFWMKTFLNCE